MFSELILTSVTSNDYAIYYEVKGATFWDNNQGANYSIQFSVAEG